ncbi:MAG: hypothetical protein PF489_09080 [Salinivirgaceae bacterium]|jgi:hypothetical protein|nr:hypothetical protein [Salinivirgaceae bacterium]
MTTLQNQKIQLTHPSISTNNPESLVEINQHYLYTDQDAFVWQKAVFEPLVKLLDAYETEYGMHLELRIKKVLSSKLITPKAANIIKPHL